MVQIIALGFGIFILVSIATAIAHNIAITLVVIALIPSPWIVRYIRMKRYFASEKFKQQKAEVQSVVAKHNEVSGYVNEIREKGKFDIGHSLTGTHANLATYTNTSKYAYKRDKNIADFASSHVHNASLQVVRNASADPIKYLIKYFDIPAEESKMEEVETFGDSISKLENAINNLAERESSIANAINPPKFILNHYLNEFREQVGLDVPPIEIPYPVYKFQYVSAGGNSSQETTVKLDSPTIDYLIEALGEKIKFRKSAAGQRALMTANFRDFIKKRDKYTCQICKISIKNEEHLLLEVDHIVPVSKGGLSTETNLQTLCWKCNRTKSNK
jgi:HNH endonuclease